MATRTVIITNISFDCSLDDPDWTDKDKLETEFHLPESYIGQVYELELDENATETDVSDELVEQISSSSGWLINAIDFNYVYIPFA